MSVILTLARSVSPRRPRDPSRRMADSRHASDILQPRGPQLTPTESGENDSWGFSPDVKLDNTLRIGFQNLGGFPEFPSHPKNHEFRSFITQYEFDIFGVAETNVKWCNMPAASQFYERIRNTWDKTQVSLAYNRMCPSRASQRVKGQSAFQQYGGVALLSTTQAAHRVSGSGRDPSGLGR
jgi:hypothetical protein